MVKAESSMVKDLQKSNTEETLRIYTRISGRTSRECSGSTICNSYFAVYMYIKISTKQISIQRRKVWFEVKWRATECKSSELCPLNQFQMSVVHLEEKDNKKSMIYLESHNRFGNSHFCLGECIHQTFVSAGRHWKWRILYKFFDSETGMGRNFR